MAVASDVSVFGDLTGGGTKDTVYTAAGTAYVSVRFFNHDSVSRNLSIWINTTASTGYVLNAGELGTMESLELEGVKMGNGDTIRAEASAASAISVIVEVDTLS